MDRLNDKGEPILISKGKKISAVLVMPEQFEKRFLDWQAKEEKKRFLKSVKGLRKGRKDSTSSITILRRLRGYSV